MLIPSAMWASGDISLAPPSHRQMFLGIILDGTMWENRVPVDGPQLERATKMLFEDSRLRGARPQRSHSDKRPRQGYNEAAEA